MLYIKWKNKFITPELSITRNKDSAAQFFDKTQAAQYLLTFLEIIIDTDFSAQDLKIVEDEKHD